MPRPQRGNEVKREAEQRGREKYLVWRQRVARCAEERYDVRVLNAVKLLQLRQQRPALLCALNNLHGDRSAAPRRPVHRPERASADHAALHTTPHNTHCSTRTSAFMHYCITALLHSTGNYGLLGYYFNELRFEYIGDGLVE